MTNPDHAATIARLEALLQGAINNHASLKEVWDDQCAHVLEACKMLGVDTDKIIGDSWTLREACLRVTADRDRQRARADEAEKERDLAIAHDRQPYPTAESYERVCAALSQMRKERDDAHEMLAFIERTYGNESDDKMTRDAQEHAARSRIVSSLAAAEARGGEMRQALTDIGQINGENWTIYARSMIADKVSAALRSAGGDPT